MSITQSTVRGVHLVGGILLPSAEDCFRKATEKMPGRLRRMPDGETGVRKHWIGFQRKVFAEQPFVASSTNSVDAHNEPGEFSVPDGLMGMLQRLETGYDTYALESYDVFCRLRKAGVIAEGIRFQVSLPTATAVVGPLVNTSYQKLVEPYYLEALHRALRRIQDQIPAKDLAIQLDIAVEIAMLEGIPQAVFKPWFSPVEEGVHDRIQQVAAAVDEGVELGFHLCYGDNDHVHFVQPKDTQLLVNTANIIVAQCAHIVSFMHMPVPKDREDDAYFAPLKGLKLGPETELYLGLVHANDEAGTRRRIAAASKVVNSFGVATECGCARILEGELDDIFETSAAVTESWS